MSVLEHAVWYASLGWRVLPLWPITPDPLDPICTCPRGAACTSPGKHPVLRDGSHGASSDAATVRKWFDREKEPNVGIATGPESGLYIIDLDGADAIRVWSELTDGKAAPDSWIVRTGTGQHHYFSSTDPLPNSASRIAPGVDSRGLGGYVVAPPSLHRTLRRYEWFARNGDRPPALPPYIVDLVKPPEQATPAAAPRVRVGESTPYAAGVLRHSLERVAAAPEGARNDTLTREAFLLGQWIGGGELDPVGIVQALEHAHPKPMDEKKVRSTIQRQLAYGAGYPRTKDTDA